MCLIVRYFRIEKKLKGKGQMFERFVTKINFVRKD